MDSEHAHRRLAEERQRVEEALAGLSRGEGDEELSHLDQHPGEEGTELFQREHDDGLVVRMRDELAAIERAEARLTDGSYGRSIDSGEPIPDARLEAMPWAERTVEEQSRYERGT